MSPTTLFMLPLLAIPGAQELLTIVVVVVLLLIIVGVINLPILRVPEDWKKYSSWAVGGMIIVFLLWTALKIAGIL